MSTCYFDFFHNLKNLAQKDLSQAHLMQHFEIAKWYANLSGIDPIEQCTWSTNKPNDTLQYANGFVNGTKHWVSGVKFCKWVIVVAKENSNLVIVKISTNDIEQILVPTVGMEGTFTINFKCNNTPAVRLFEKGDQRYFLPMSGIHLTFIGNHLGIGQALLKDILNYTKNRFDYNVKKLQLDLDILEMLWETEVNNFGIIPETQSGLDDLWSRRNNIYAFAKKTLVGVTNFVTEVTGSGLFRPEFPGHQRFKDALIYSTHQKNLSVSLDEIYRHGFYPQ